ncbi:MAG: type II toxin-antitoxin system VapC family toxin [Chloroflexota bacterium]|nr:type II toxin-antitoxin system VapC family toxin [Chloroflexota bacterium]
MSEREGWGSTSVVIDSDILIDHLRGREVAIDFIDSLLLDGVEVCFSVISEAEIYSNVRPGEEPRILILFENLTRLNLDGVTARKAGAYRLTYLPSDRLALPDALIAATAFVHQAVLLTRNVRHYPMTDLEVVAPYHL